MAGDVPGGKVVERHCVALGAAAVRQRRIEGDEALEGSARCEAANTVGVPARRGARRGRCSTRRCASRRFRRRRRGRLRSRWPSPRPWAPRRVRLRATTARARDAPGRARQQHRVERHVVGAVVAIAAGAFDVVHDDVLYRHLQGQRHVGAQIVDALAVRPDPHAIAAGPLRDGAGGRHRGMRDEGAGILVADRARHPGRRRRPCVDRRCWSRRARS